jgi:hypothetical protein
MVGVVAYRRALKETNGVFFESVRHNFGTPAVPKNAQYREIVLNNGALNSLN